MQTIQSLILAAILIVAWQHSICHGAGALHFIKGAPHVQLANGGIISGSMKFSRDGRPYHSFQGIPFGTIPKRFDEAKPIVTPTWKGTFSATKPGAMCVQNSRNAGDYFGDEDCLNLNVYVPMNATGPGKKGYAVMVWIHGGAFTSGSGSAYGPKFFMDENVILVTINYRLGVFGFLSTGDGVVPGNNGLKDMVVALRWVQDNIKQFNGNKDSVTIFGESAGGGAVHYLMLSPLSKGLFHRAISQSGTALNMWAYEPNPKQVAVELATYLKCPTKAVEASEISSEEILTCLSNVSAEELKNAQLTFKLGWPPVFRSLFFAPTTESVEQVTSLTPFLPEPPESILTNKNHNLTEIQWMVGVTEDEGAAMFAGPVLAKPELLEELSQDWDNVAPRAFDYGRFVSADSRLPVSHKLKQFYFSDKSVSKETRAALANAFTDAGFLYGIYKSAVYTASRGKRNPVYLYQYAYKGPISLIGTFFQFDSEESKKVGHGDDLLLLFDMEAMIPGEIIKPDSPVEEFSKNFVRLWTSFAIHGEPKHSWGSAAFRKWKPIPPRQAAGLDPVRWLRIDENPTPYEIAPSYMERINLWDDIWTEHVAPRIMSKVPPSLPGKIQTSESNKKTEL